MKKNPFFFHVLDENYDLPARLLDSRETQRKLLCFVIRHMSCQKLGIILGNKVLQKLKLKENVF